MGLYPALRLLHVSCVVDTAAGFLLRGLWMLGESPLLRHPLTRVLPHVNDNLLLAAGIGLAMSLRQYPLVEGWLTAKLAMVNECLVEGLCEILAPGGVTSV